MENPTLPTNWLAASIAVETGTWGIAAVIPKSANAGDVGSVPGSRRSPGEGNGNPLVFLPRKFHGERSLVDYSP